MNIYGNKVVNIDVRLWFDSSFKHTSTKVTTTFICLQQPPNPGNTWHKVQQ